MDYNRKMKFLNINKDLFFVHDLLKKTKKYLGFNKIPLTNNSSIKPVFIVGCGRSGNTLLRSIINSHSDIIVPPETYVIGKMIQLHYCYNNMNWDEYINLMISTLDYHSEFYTFEIPSLRKLAIELKKEKENRSLSHVIDSLYRFHAKNKNKKINRWGDKTPINSMYVYRIKKVFPDAKFIYLIRDGIDVTYSYVRAGLMDNYKKAAIRWKETNLFIENFCKKEKKDCMKVSYENLVSKPEVIIKEICKFIDLNYQKTMINRKNISEMGDIKFKEHHQNVFNNINTDSIGKGRTNIDCITIKQEIGMILNDLLLKNGYNKI